MKKVFIALVGTVALAACSKDKFETVPAVKIDSLNPAEVIKGQIFTLTATVTDKEGDVNDSVLLVRKLYLTTLTNEDTIRVSMNTLGAPSGLTKFQLQAVFDYGETKPDTIFQDYDNGKGRNITIGVIVIDREGHRSPYVESNKILLKEL